MYKIKSIVILFLFACTSISAFTFERSVITSHDDAEEKRGRVYLNSSDLELVEDKGKNQIIGLRFTNICIPKNATITKAYLQFTVDEKDSKSTRLKIYGEHVTNAKSFTKESHNISSRRKTISSEIWYPKKWNHVGKSGKKQRTCDLKKIVQELVNQARWSSGYAMAFIISGTGKRVADSYEGGNAPILHIEYSVEKQKNRDTIILASNESVLGSVLKKELKYYKINASSGETIRGLLTELQADADLYMKVGSKATNETFDCKSIHTELRDEDCSLTVENDEDVYLTVYGFRASSYALKAIKSGNEDITKPIISLLGEEEVTVLIGSTYIDFGATAIDNIDGNITENINIINTVNTDNIGTYSVKYNVKDTSNNNAIEVSRMVYVALAPQSEKLVYEDAENGSTDNWIIHDNDPFGATITNVYDSTKNSQVIQFMGEKKKNSYEYGAEFGDRVWNNKLDRTIEWNMNFNGPYKIYVFIKTSNGRRKMVYDFENTNKGFINDYIHHGLGLSSRNGNWHTYSRDLQADLEEYEAGNIILAVNGIRVYGSGKIDDIKMLKVSSPEDHIAPSITLIGSETVNIEHHANYRELGAIASDEITGNIQVSIRGEVDTSTIGTYKVKYIAVDRAGNVSLKKRTVNVISVNTETTSLILNEYNAVASNKKLKVNGNDVYFGQVNGNGNSWIELVTTVRHLDLRGITLNIHQNGVDDFQAKIPNLEQLAHLRKGTIVTISSEPTDLSYAPFNPNSDDWTLNINIDDLVVEQGSFSIGSESAEVMMSNNEGKILLAATGERISAVAIDNQEVFKLKKNPLHGIKSTDIAYGDDNDEKALSTFGEENIWLENGELKRQNFNELRANKDLIEVGGIVVSDIDSLNEIEDAESLLYIPENNSLWIADDDSHKIYEMNFATKELESSFDDVQLGVFAETIKDACFKRAKPAHSDGACDIESIAYDREDDIFYIFVGNTASQSAVYKLTRDNINDNFELEDYRDLNYTEYGDALFINDEFIVVENGKNLYTYNFNDNTIVGNRLFTSEYGKIFGLAYANDILWITTSKYKLLKLHWSTKEIEAVYHMPDNGVFDPRGIEVIDNKLYILEGINAMGDNQVLAPYNHTLKNSIHIYDVP